jgi:uncharacterized protein YjdB
MRIRSLLAPAWLHLAVMLTALLFFMLGMSRAVAATCPCTIWPATATPATANDPEAIAIELGVKFRSDVNGYISGIRFYKGSTNSGTHIGSLWTASGTRMAQATFTNETATGWQEVNFASPVAINANTTYVASYYAPNGHYSVTEPGLTAGVDNAPLHALASSVSPNGVYKADGGFPTDSYNATNYWVDVVFQTSIGPAPTLSSITVTPANPAIQAGATQQFTATGTYSDNSTQNLTSQVTWISSNTGVATINANGLATGVAPGTSIIFAELGGVSGNTALTVGVTPTPTLSSIAVTPANPTIQTGATQQFTATGTYSDNSTQNLTNQVTWSSSNTAAATISTAGLASGVGSGTTTISAGLSGVTGNTTLTVQTNQPATTTGFLNPAVNTVATGGDNNGYQTNTSNAYTNDGLFAVDTNSGNNNRTSCTDSGKDKHLFYNYGFNLPTSSTVNGIEVRLDAKVDSTGGAPKICVQLSWDGGTSWTTAKITSTLTTNEATYVLGAAADNWGRTWTPNDFSNNNFRVRIIDVSSNTSRDFSLDWVAVGVTYLGSGSNVTLSSIAVTPANPTLQTGATQQFTATGTYSDNSTQNITGQVTWSSSNTAAATISTAGLASGVGAGTATISAALSGRTGSTTLTVQTSGGGSNCPCTIWPATATPATAADPEAIAIELGVKFKSDVTGYISGIRFYKGSTNTGTHTGSLWTASGTRLAQATFTNETATGWQQVNFASPVAITAGTTYVASYFAPTGHYSVTSPGLTSGVDTAPLHALANSVSPNGVYKAGGGFPTDDYNSTNYWVDVVFITSTSGSDITSPTVTSTSPANNATGISLGTTITVTFNEAMNTTSIGTATFELFDNNNATVPSTVIFDIATNTATLSPADPLVPSAAYSATVKGGSGGVKDMAGNPMANDFTWSFTAAAQDVAQQVGQWASPISWPLVVINVTLTRTGEVLLWDGGARNGEPNADGGLTARLWNPVTQAFTPVPINNYDLFCSGHCVLPNGNVFVAGGHDLANNILGAASAAIFNPVTRAWTNARSMSYRRWYPTTTCLPDGRVLVTSGSEFNDTEDVDKPEIYNPQTDNWTVLNNAPLATPLYPYAFVLPDGRIVNAGSYEASIATDVLDLATQQWSVVDPNPVGGGTAVMYLPGKIMKAGMPARVGENYGPSSAKTWVLDMTVPPPNSWRETPSMSFRRSYHSMTLLPDGTTLVTGGGTTLDGVDVTKAVLPAEIWSPVTQNWTQVASLQRPRLYHSTALLLPDGRVLVAGGGRNFVNSVAEFSAEIYTPPYLFKGARPKLTSFTSNVTYGGNISVQTPDAANIVSVNLVRPGSMTHSFNQDQRFVPLTFQQTSGGLNVTAPSNANIAPPGYYMLFLLNSNGVPSQASFIKLS